MGVEGEAEELSEATDGGGEPPPPLHHPVLPAGTFSRRETARSFR